MRGRRDHRPQYRYRIMLGGGLLLTIASFTMISKMTLFGAWPDVVTLYALFFVLYGNHREGGYLPVMALGVVRDLFSISTFGTSAILYGLLHKAMADRKGLAYRENPLMLILLAFVAVFFVNFLSYMMIVIQGHGAGLSFGITKAALMALVSAPLMPVVVFCMCALLTLIRVEELKGGAYNI